MYNSPVGYYRLGASAPRTGTREGYPRRRKWPKRLLAGGHTYAKSASAGVILARATSSGVARHASATVGIIFAPTDSAAEAHTATATATFVAYSRAFENVTLARSASRAPVFAAAASVVLARPKGATAGLAFSISTSSIVTQNRLAPRTLVLGAVATVVVSYKSSSGYPTARFAVTASVANRPHRSARLNIILGASAGTGKDFVLAAAVGLKFRAGARFVGPPSVREVNYLGRFQQGQEITLRLQAILVDRTTVLTPIAAPLARVYRDGVLQRILSLPSDFSSPGDVGLFRGRYTLGAADLPGRYAVVYLYGLNFKTRAACDVFEVVPGGDPAGPVISTYSLERPDGDVVLAQLGSGRLAAAQGAYIDEGL